MTTRSAPAKPNARAPAGNGGAHVHDVVGLDDIGDLGNIGNLRALSWTEALWLVALARENGEGQDGPWRPPSPGTRFIHEVPPPLKRMGCMWMENGSERQRCGQPVTWTMGANLSMARLYCEHHGQKILQRRAEGRRAREAKRRKRAEAEV